ncbi:MAG TPA: hypothetical protein VFK06_07180 [Candidatus Angelobacter sp.]|nr:hypothetical protein [Candidatus Angelobacter sp.]
MPKIDLVLDSNNVGNFNLDSQDIYALGGPDFPALHIRIDFGIMPFQQYRQANEFKPLTCISITGEFCSPPERLVARFQYAECHHSSRTDTRLYSSQMTFVIPLDLKTIDLIEQSRNGNLQAAIKIKPLLAIHSPDDKTIETLRYASVQEMRFTVPKSEWVEKILPGLGYKGLQLLEFRVGDSAVAQQLPQAIEEFKQAQQHLLNAEWERAVHRCRNALELIVSARSSSIAETSKFASKINAFINDHLSANDEQADLIAKQMNLLWQVCSSAAHPSPIVTRTDAEFILRTTMSLICYCGKLLKITS